MISDQAILTVLATVPPADAFRPPYVGNSKPLYRSNNLQMNFLSNLPAPASRPSLNTLETYIKRPWVDHMTNYTGDQVKGYNNSPDYSREQATMIGEVALALMTNLPDKTNLVRYLVQLGIDYYHALQLGGSWPANGGHGSGRKFPILFAGLMLSDASMLSIGSNVLSSSNTFGEDAQTFYVRQSDINRAHYLHYDPTVRIPPEGEYGSIDLGVPEWGIRHATYPQFDNALFAADYRECCTALSWNGFLLAARLLGLQSAWNNDAVFDYEDRYMSAQPSGNYRSSSVFNERMWDLYR